MTGPMLKRFQRAAGVFAVKGGGEIVRVRGRESGYQGSETVRWRQVQKRLHEFHLIRIDWYHVSLLET